MADMSMSQHTGRIAAGDAGAVRFRLGGSTRLLMLVVSVRCAEAAPTDAQLDGSVRVKVWASGFRTALDTFVPLVHRGGVATVPIAHDMDSNGDVDVEVSDARDSADMAFAVRASVTLLVNESNTHAPRY